ncbi:MAG: CBS domain-containing protein [Bacteroidales bacterium]
MVANDYLNKALIPLKPKDSLDAAVRLMDEYRVIHYPVVKEGVFIGLLSEKDIISAKNPNGTIEQVLKSLQKIFVQPCQHIFDVFRIVVTNELSLIPVVNEKNEYKGAVALKELRKAVGDYSACDSPGSIIVLEMSQNDYYLSEITRLIEENNARVLALFLKSFSESTKIEVNIKINKLKPEAILQTFRRYGYEIKAYWAESYEESDTLKDRYDSLMKYLNI